MIKTRETCGNWDPIERMCIAVKPEAACDPYDPRYDPADCPFWISETDKANGREAALRRIATLPEDQKRRIARNYYEGACPWKKYEGKKA